MLPAMPVRLARSAPLLLCALAACGETAAPNVTPDAAPDAAPVDAQRLPDTAGLDGASSQDVGPPPAPNAVLPLVSRDGRMFDAAGREVLLRGINARVRDVFDVTFDNGRLPLIPVEVFTGEDCRFLAGQLGLNLLRLPINWSAIEPTRGTYDDTYLDRVGAVIDACAAEGVYTLVDLHQDAFSKEIGQDGAPLWAIAPPPTQLLGGPLTDLEIRRLSAQVIAAFGSLYDNRDGLSDAHAAMAAHVAAYLGARPGVAGLELHNEPVSFQAPRLADFHARSGQAVRAVAPDLPVHFEPDALRNLRDAAAVTHPVPFGGAVYAPHIYTGVFSRGRDNWADANVEALEGSTRGTRVEADAHGAALLIGEYGIDPRAPNALRWLAEEHRLFDEVLAGAAFWIYEEYGEGGWGLFDNAGTPETPARGALRAEIATAIAHPFPQAVDGRLVSTRYDADADTLTVVLEVAGLGEHWLSAPGLRWPAGVRATCDGAEVGVTTGPGRVGVRCPGRTLTLRGAGG